MRLENILDSSMPHLPSEPLDAPAPHVQASGELSEQPMVETANTTPAAPLALQEESEASGAALAVADTENADMPRTNVEDEEYARALGDLEEAGGSMGIEDDRSFHPTSSEEDISPYTFPQPDEGQAAARVDENTVPPPLMEEDGAIEGQLVLDPEEARQELLDQAVTAIDVKPVQPERRNKRKWIPALIVVTVVILAAVGVSLGITLGRKTNPPEPTITDPPTEPPTLPPTSSRFTEVAALVESSLGNQVS